VNFENFTVCRQILNVSLDLDPEPIALNTVLDCVLLNDHAFIITPFFIYYPIEFDPNERLPPLSRGFNVSLMRTVDEAIYFYHKHHRTYFHLIAETVPHLLAFPREIVARSVLIHTPDLDIGLFREVLDIFDFHPREMCPLSEAFFVRELHVCTPWRCSEFRCPDLFAMVSRILDRTGASNITAVKRVAFNRLTRSRSLKNFPEMMHAIQVEIPRANFESIRTHPRRLDEQVRFFRSVLVLLTVRGSILANIVWLQPGTRLIQIQSLQCDAAFSKLATFFGIRTWEVTFPIPLLHNPFAANIPVVLQAVRLALKDLAGDK
jgi:hypothetical protein